jgi:anti-sigma factor RsiW
MNVPNDRLERLFSRCLDGAATPTEHGLLERLCRDDETIAARFDDYRRFDAQIGAALRAELAPAPRVARLQAWLRHAGRTLALATAACLAGFAWLGPQPTPDASSSKAIVHAGQLASWFRPAEPPVDTVEPASTAYERPELRVRGTQRDWIVVPGEDPDTYFVIEVDRVRTHVMAAYQDF